MTTDALKGKQLGGTNVKEQAFEKGAVLYSMFEPRLEYAWDNGQAIGRYLQGLKQGRLLATECHQCGRVLVPPREFCELCWRPSDGWTEVQDTGTVQTFSISRINWDASRRPEGSKPLIPAVIALDGAGEKTGIMHLLDDVDEKDLKIGMRVRAVWRPEAERTGAITDILYFAPMDKPARKTARGGRRAG